MIPWLYNNKYYIIECCDNKISINNIFDALLLFNYDNKDYILLSSDKENE